MNTSFWVVVLYMLGVVCIAPALAREAAKQGLAGWIAVVGILFWPIAVYIGMAITSYGKKR